MIPVPSMQGKTAAVLGLGRSGRSACRALHASGARVWAWDDAPARRAEAAAAGLSVVDLAICNWGRVDRLVLSPGIPLHHPRPHPVVRRARDAGIEVVGDLELLVENQPQRRIVGITGTNGKSTTTVLAGALLRAAGIGVQVGGNIGLPVLDLWPKPEDDIYVLELSSYQLELTERLSCSVAVILNLSPDHLDRHGGMNGYLRAKRRILRNQRASNWALIGVDDAHGQALFEQLRLAGRQRLLPFAVGRSLTRGIYVLEGQLYDALERAAEPVIDLRPIASLRGAHNWQNAAAAYGVARALGVAPEAAAAGLREFQGLAHRMEAVATLGGVAFVNDSKATNPEAAARALASFERIYWIAGGRPKQSSLDALLPWLDRVRHAYLIGEAAAPFAAALSSRVSCTQSGELATALAQAAGAARADRAGAAVVLLSPACASFDQFADFEARGDAFKALVGDLVSAASRKARGVIAKRTQAAVPAVVEAGR
jgi:UDP-N-acetylmuramoylalanine--D-glutamate ligase